MHIDTDVAEIAAKRFLDPQLVQAIIVSEGNIIKAVQCTYPEITTREQAINILCNSLVHRLMDFAGQSPFLFVSYFGNKWAPSNVKNDPKHLNENWIPNVLKLWGKS